MLTDWPDIQQPGSLNTLAGQGQRVKVLGGLGSGKAPPLALSALAFATEKLLAGSVPVVQNSIEKLIGGISRMQKISSIAGIIELTIGKIENGFPTVAFNQSDRYAGTYRN